MVKTLGVGSLRSLAASHSYKYLEAEKVVPGLSRASYIMRTSALYFTEWHELCAAGPQRCKVALNQAAENSFYSVGEFRNTIIFLFNCKLGVFPMCNIGFIVVCVVCSRPLPPRERVLFNPLALRPWRTMF